MNYSLFTDEEAFIFPGVALRRTSHLSPCPLCLYCSPTFFISIHLHPPQHTHTHTQLCITGSVGSDLQLCGKTLPKARSMLRLTLSLSSPLEIPSCLISLTQLRNNVPIVKISVMMNTLGIHLHVLRGRGMGFVSAELAALQRLDSDTQTSQKKEVRDGVSINPRKFHLRLLHTKMQTHTHTLTQTITQLMQPLINLLLPGVGFHIWGPNSLHLIGPLRKLQSCSHLQGHTHTQTHKETHTDIRHVVTQNQSVQSSLGNVHSSILSFIHLLSPGSSLL